ncbi:hypothetical protein DVH07_18545 [Hafnia paralvei]|nr:hypothetical protein DU449_18105 [Hafnia paralvei]RDA62995.1 hypothetical protein DVH08_20315 [Hafnia paralvei]RDA63835.1 hypothetical protein DVH09_18675 [Hafnia paralvei]RDA75121.1 hypothetical protein DVH10_17845 [Hafnia paralvei]RDA75526.1 hypothetical protein DVH07_18545 [Hafnia paralvei]
MIIDLCHQKKQHSGGLFDVRLCNPILKLLQIKIIRLGMMTDGNANKLYPVKRSGDRLFSF